MTKWILVTFNRNLLVFVENATCQRDIFFVFDSYSQGLQTLLSSIMVTNPQERPRISWVLDQVQNLCDSSGTDVDTNRVWCFLWDFMSVFQWTLDVWDYALGQKQPTELTSLANICSVLPQWVQHGMITHSSAITLAFASMSRISPQNTYWAMKLWFWSKMWTGHVPDFVGFTVMAHKPHNRGLYLL